MAGAWVILPAATTEEEHTMTTDSSKPVMAPETNDSAPSGALRRRLLASALALAFAGIPTIASATHSWGGYHWARTANPFTLQLGDNLSQAWRPYLVNTRDHWNNDWAKWTTPTYDPPQPVLQTTIVTGATNPKRCAATSGMVQVCNALYGNNGWLGVAQIWISTLHITKGAVKVNDTYFNTATYTSSAWRNMVMCQEVGHTFGLNHQNEQFSLPNLGTCMDYTSDPTALGSNGQDNQFPNYHDYEELGIIYKHFDSSTTVAASSNVSAMPREWGEGDFGERSQWGALVRSSKNGLKEIYRRDFGGGYQIITFVTWAAGEGRGRR
jgi:hypothetical protein